jgi:hypothetical protein
MTSTKGMIHPSLILVPVDLMPSNLVQLALLLRARGGRRVLLASRPRSRARGPPLRLGALRRTA